MRSYMTKCLAGIAYEQNRLTGVASALIAQFVFLAKSALKILRTGDRGTTSTLLTGVRGNR